MQMQQMRLEQAEQRHRDAGERHQARHPGQRGDAGDDGRGRQHDGDLEGGGSKLEVMIFRGGLVALMLGVLGAFGELLRTLAGLGLRAIARRSLLPVVDLLDRKSVV